MLFHYNHESEYIRLGVGCAVYFNVGVWRYLKASKLTNSHAFFMFCFILSETADLGNLWRKSLDHENSFVI